MGTATRSESHRRRASSPSFLTFFAVDPLRQYKDLPRSKKIWLSLQHVFPVLDWGRNYSLGKFKGDLIAGLTIASLCIPQVSEPIPLLMISNSKKHRCTDETIDV